MEKARKRLETKFAEHPGSAPVEGVEEQYWAPRTEVSMQLVHDVLFKEATRSVIVGPSGSGKTSTVKMVARKADRDGIVFVDLKKAKSSQTLLHACAAAFDVNVDKAYVAIPRAIREYHQKTGRVATIIIEDAQGALMSESAAVAAGLPLPEEFLQSLSECVEANALNMVFLSSEGSLPGQLRSMSGWSAALCEVELAPIDEATMTKHLQEVWKLDEPTVREIVDKVGTGTRDVFRRILGANRPGDTIAKEEVGGRINDVIVEAINRINDALEKLPHKQFDQAASSRSTRRAAVLLLDRLTIAPSTSAHEVMSARGMGKMYPDVPQFEDAVRTLIKDNVLHKHIRGGQVAWHRRALRTAWQAAMEKGQHDDVRKAAPSWFAWTKFLVAG